MEKMIHSDINLHTVIAHFILSYVGLSLPQQQGRLAASKGHTACKSWALAHMCLGKGFVELVIKFRALFLGKCSATNPHSRALAL